SINSRKACKRMSEAFFIDPEDIGTALRKRLEAYKPETSAAQVGRVVEVGDGIARVGGLPSAGVNELLEFEGGVMGIALNLDEETIGAVIPGDAQHLEEGQTVKATGRILEIAVGDGLLGRVVDPLGNPLDGKGPIPQDIIRRVEIQA